MDVKHHVYLLTLGKQRDLGSIPGAFSSPFLSQKL